MTPIYCISCTQHTERRSVAEQHFASCGVVPTWWRGYHGSSWGLESSKRYGDYRITPGHIGSILSHYSLWQHLDSYGCEEAIILEDDALLPVDFERKVLVLINDLPLDWQFCFLGWIDRSEQQHIPVNESVIEMRYPFGTHAYMVHRTALPLLLDAMAEARTNVDIQLNENALPKLRCYAANPSFVDQRTQTGEWKTSTATVP